MVDMALLIPFLRQSPDNLGHYLCNTNDLLQWEWDVSIPVWCMLQTLSIPMGGVLHTLGLEAVVQLTDDAWLKRILVDINRVREVHTLHDIDVEGKRSWGRFLPDSANCPDIKGMLSSIMRALHIPNILLRYPCNMISNYSQLTIQFEIPRFQQLIMPKHLRRTPHNFKCFP